jgi:hypothetical protein
MTFSVEASSLLSPGVLVMVLFVLVRWQDTGSQMGSMRAGFTIRPTSALLLLFSSGGGSMSLISCGHV